ncbi:guanine nucleotide-binding protein subunit alpha-11-like isoform X1 [Varroa destructor]|uniref:Uncharacterized protein n=3 Tax=Varroa destructor TaxID=109461 RepID=A0A7M7K0R6_VARDE|nr:guanine nucleotide-binding protein subunit alpha-11-like isoform X1 [Varroa destructor]XP_022658777.1 guanine nucleotide-binding protein subunit alpha-11-like isoform X1 [Varroa destructor]
MDRVYVKKEGATQTAETIAPASQDRGLETCTLRFVRWPVAKTACGQRRRSEVTATMEIACCLNQEAKLQRKVNDEIEKQLTREKTDLSKETKFLLLGPNDVGKTTFMKQMRIIGTTGYEKDLGEHVCPVFIDLVHAMQTIVRAMDLLGIPYRNPATVECAMVVSSVRASDISTALPMNLVEALRRLWDDPGIKECYKRRIEYGLGEGAQHFVKNITRITTSGYVPSQEDYLCIKTPSKYISEYNMMLDDEFPLRFVDVGEQKSETKKWIHCFEDVGGVIFMVSLSDYDNEAKMLESQKLFQLIARSNWFTESHILLLLNKKDVMEEKVKHGMPFSDIYKDFHGVNSDVRSCREYMRRMFAQLEPDRPVYFFFTNATDTEDIRYVLPTLREIASAKTGTRNREVSDAATSTSAMAAVAAAMNGVSTAAAVGAIASPGRALVCPTGSATNTAALVHPLDNHDEHDPLPSTRPPQLHQLPPTAIVPLESPLISLISPHHPKSGNIASVSVNHPYPPQHLPMTTDPAAGRLHAHLQDHRHVSSQQQNHSHHHQNRYYHRHNNQNHQNQVEDIGNNPYAQHYSIATTPPPMLLQNRFHPHPSSNKHKHEHQKHHHHIHQHTNNHIHRH